MDLPPYDHFLAEIKKNKKDDNASTSSKGGLGGLGGFGGRLGKLGGLQSGNTSPVHSTISSIGGLHSSNVSPISTKFDMGTLKGSKKLPEKKPKMDLQSAFNSKLVLESTKKDTNDTALAKYLADNAEIQRELVNAIKLINTQNTKFQERIIKTLDSIIDKTTVAFKSADTAQYHAHNNESTNVKTLLKNMVLGIDQTITQQKNHAYIIIPGSDPINVLYRDAAPINVTVAEAATMLADKTIHVLDSLESLTYNYVLSEDDPDYTGEEEISESDIMEAREELVLLKQDL